MSVVGLSVFSFITHTFNFQMAWPVHDFYNADILPVIIIIIIRLQEKHTRDQLKDHFKSIVGMQTELKSLCERIIELQSKMEQTYKRQEQLLATHGNK